MAKVVQRVKLSWLERLYIPALWNGFKVTLGHFFSWKKSKVYEAANKDNQFKTTLNYPEELWTVPKGFRGAPYLVSDQDGATKCVSCQLCEFVCPPKAIRITPPGETGEDAHREGGGDGDDLEVGLGVGRDIVSVGLVDDEEERGRVRTGDAL